nr:MAG TPA: Serpin-type proteinase inhibitor, hydrolase inhibitor [Caudoviricetes sp.]
MKVVLLIKQPPFSVTHVYMFMIYTVSSNARVILGHT